MTSVSDCLSESCGFKSRQYCKTGKITIGCLPALDAGGCRFEPYFSDKIKCGNGEIGKYARFRI